MGGKPLPSRISFITLGARDVAALRRFYTAMGWTENAGSSDDFASFTAGSVRLALYPLEALGAEAAPGARAPEQGGWNGTTLAVNLPSREQAERAWRAAVDAGAEAVAPPVAREWGGFSGYVADPEGNRWEVAYAPGYPSGYDSVTPRIFVSDLDAQIRFLCEVFGAVVEVEQPPVEIRIGNTKLMVSPTSHERDAFPAFLYVYVEDADASFDAAVSAGASVVEAPTDTPYGDRRATVRDAFGNVFQIAHRL